MKPSKCIAIDNRDTNYQCKTGPDLLLLNTTSHYHQHEWRKQGHCMLLVMINCYDGRNRWLRQVGLGSLCQRYFQLYRDIQFYSGSKLKYADTTTVQQQNIDKIYHTIVHRVHLSMSRIRTLNASSDLNWLHYTTTIQNTTTKNNNQKEKQNIKNKTKTNKHKQIKASKNYQKKQLGWYKKGL